jgi:hypothetical protein
MPGDIAGLTLHVGGWTTGLQLITVKRLTVKKTELCPRKSRTEGNRPTEWARINGMRIANWNVRTLHTAGAMNEVVKEMAKHKVGILFCKKLDDQGK